METIKTTKLEATKENIELAMAQIKIYAAARGYVINGDLSQGGAGILSKIFGTSKYSFESGRQEKVLRNYLTRLDRKVTMATANKFLHFLYRRIYKLDTAPRIEYSMKETAIQAARIKWKTKAKETEILRLAYKTEKGDFYKNVQILDKS